MPNTTGMSDEAFLKLSPFKQVKILNALADLVAVYAEYKYEATEDNFVTLFCEEYKRLSRLFDQMISNVLKVSEERNGG